MSDRKIFLEWMSTRLLIELILGRSNIPTVESSKSIMKRTFLPTLCGEKTPDDIL